MRLDSTDLRILAELQEDARISIVALAKKVALTPTPCARRVELLEKAGYIRGYATVLDQNLLNLPVNAFVEVRLTRENKSEVAEFEAAVHRYPEVMECWAMSGSYDYLLRVVTSDLEGYNRFLRSELLNLRCVYHVETSFALERVVARQALPLHQAAKRPT